MSLSRTLLLVISVLLTKQIAHAQITTLKLPQNGEDAESYDLSSSSNSPLLSVFSLLNLIFQSENDGSAISNPSPSEVPCDVELETLCGMDIPNSIDSIFNARMCLWSNRDEISPSCKKYLTEDRPSIVEPCLPQIQMFCPKVNAGAGRIHSCLNNHYLDLSVRCANAMKQEGPAPGSDVYEDDFNPKTIVKVTTYQSPYYSSFPYSLVSMVDLLSVFGITDDSSSDMYNTRPCDSVDGGLGVNNLSDGEDDTSASTTTAETFIEDKPKAEDTMSNLRIRNFNNPLSVEEKERLARPNKFAPTVPAVSAVSDSVPDAAFANLKFPKISFDFEDLKDYTRRSLENVKTSIGTATKVAADTMRRIVA